MIFFVTFFSPAYFKNTGYNTYNIQNTRSSTVYVAGKASGQQQATSSYIFEELRVIHGFLTAQGFGTPAPMLFKSQLYIHKDTHTSLPLL